MVLRRLKTAMEIYSHLPRYRQIFGVLYKYGFGELLKLIQLQRKLKIQDSDIPDTELILHKKSAAERLRLAFEELGPTFIKLGQILSTRRDLIDETMVAELSKLQDQVPPFSPEKAKAIIEEQLGQSVGKLFKEFDEKPVAAASLAQVHRAVSHDGDILAIKIQRPDIAEVIEEDLAILMDIARFLEKHATEIAALNPVGVVREFSKALYTEQDFSNEARNMERFASQFRHARTIRIPHVYRELSTGKVLTMEFVTGYPIDQLDVLRKNRIDPVKLSEKISKLIFQQMFRYGFFHGDPHPGNMTVLEGEVIALYDYGMMGNLNAVFRQNVAFMIMGLTEKDHRMVTRSLLGMSEEGFTDNVQQLEVDVEDFSDKYLDRPLKDLKLGFVLNRLLDVLTKHKLRMKADFYLGIKALTQVESIGELLNPDLNFVQFGKSYATEVIERKWDLKTVFRNLYISLADSADFLKDVPLDLQELYQKIRSGRYTIPIEHRINPAGFEPMRNTFNHIANRLTHAIITSSIIICSGLLILADAPPRWHEISLPGIAGLILAAVLGVRLWLSISKRGGF